MDAEDLSAWLRLALTDGAGPSTLRQLLSHFGLPQAVLSAPEAALAACAGPKLARALQAPPEDFAQRLGATRAWLAADPLQRAVVALGHPGYPAALLQADDPPVLLYLQGTPAARQALATGAGTGLAIVGSRQPTPQGLLHARQFAHAIASAGATIVSGLAAGIDGAAHDGALSGSVDSGIAHPLPTIAVVGTGLDRVYPRRHLALAHRIAQHGVILSEYPIGTPPLAANFPRRNRLIAALSRATLVVEAALASGSLITARMALEQGRDVMAIPGSIQSPQSRGCHALIKQGARLVDCVQDVLDELGLQPPATATALSGVPSSSNGDDITGHATTDTATDPVLAAMGHDPVAFDALLARCGLDAPTLQAHLLALELDGRLARLPGGRLQRL